MSGVSKILRDIDIYGETFSFNLNKKESITSPLGGVFTLLTYILTCLLISYNLYTWIESSNPIVTVSTFYRNSTEVERIDPEILEFGLGFTEIIKDANPKPFVLGGKDLLNINTTLFPVFSQNKNPVGNLQPCNIYNTSIEETDALIEAAQQSKSELLPLRIYKRYNQLSSNIYCNKYNSSSTINIVSDPLVTGIFSSFVANTEFDICSIDSNCLSTQHLIDKSKALNNKLLFFYKDTYPLMSDSLGFQSDIVTEIVDIDFTQNYNLVLTIKKNIINTDSNILFNFKPRTTQSFYSMVLNVWPRTKAEQEPKNINYITIKYILDKQINVYDRSYEKLDSLVANTYAMYGVILIMSQILVGYLDIRKVDFYLMNKLYHYQYSGEIEAKNNFLSSKQPVLEPNNVVVHEVLNDGVNKPKAGWDLSNHKNYGNALLKKDIITTKMVNSNQNTEFERKVLKLLKVTYLGCGKKSNFNKSLTLGNSLLEYDFNIIVMMRKLIEYEKVINILFNEEQLNLIKSINNRTITIEDANLEQFLKLDYSNEAQNPITPEFPKPKSTETQNYLHVFNSTGATPDTINQRILNLVN